MFLWEAKIGPEVATLPSAATSSRRRMNGSCDNTVGIPVAEMNVAVLTAVEDHALTPEAVEATIALMQRDDQRAAVRSLDAERAEVQKHIDRLVAAIAAGDEIPSLLGSLQECETRKAVIAEEIASARPIPMPTSGRWLRTDWLAAVAVAERCNRPSRPRPILDGRIVFTPVGAGYEFKAPTRYDRLFTGLVVPQSLWRSVWEKARRISGLLTCTTGAKTTQTTAEFWNGRSTV